MRRLLTFVFIVTLVLLATVSYAETFGLIPTLAKADKPKVETRAESAPELPGKANVTVVGLEALSWYGSDAAVAFAVTGKREIGGGWKRVDGRFYVGWLAGISESGDSAGNFVTGGIVQLAIGEIPALSVLVRPEDGGVKINPGINFTLFGTMF